MEQYPEKIGTRKEKLEQLLRPLTISSRRSLIVKIPRNTRIKEMMQPIPFRYRNFLIKPNSETSCNMAIFLNASYLDPYQPLSREIRYKTRSRKEGGGGKARGRQL